MIKHVSLYRSLMPYIEEIRLNCEFPIKNILCFPTLDSLTTPVEGTEYLILEDMKRYDWKKAEISRWTGGVAQNILFHVSTFTELGAKIKEIVDRKDKFPMIFIDSTQVTTTKMDRISEFQYITAGKVIIACASYNENATSDVREVQNFEPILRPLLDSFIDMLQRRGILAKETGVPYSFQEHYFYGANGQHGYDGNLFGNFVDAIEIKNLKLKLKYNCNI